MREIRHRWRFHHPHPGQSRLERLIENRSARVITAACGRRSGKTTGVAEIIARLSLRRRPLAVGWFAPTYKQAKIAWFKTLWSLPASTIVSKNAAELELKLNTGSRWNFWGMDRPDNALGWGYDVAVIDEAARISGYARDEIIAPMVADNDGLIIDITSPKGKKGRGAHVWRDWKKAEAKEPGFFKVKFATHENPRPGIQKWVRFAEKNLPTDIYRQEILAEFLDSGGQLLDFTPIATLAGSEQSPIELPYVGKWEPEEDAYAGLDLGQKTDYTVLGVFGGESGRLLACDRFKHLPWSAAIARVYETLKKFCRRKADRGKPTRSVILYVDVTGLGGPVVETMFEDVGELPIEIVPTTFDNELKQTLIQGLQVAVERREIEIPYITEAISEAETLEMDPLSSGRIRYGAAAGFHDDIIMAWGLAVLALNRRITGVIR